MSHRKASTLVSCGTGFCDNNLELAKLSRVIKLDGCDGLVDVPRRARAPPGLDISLDVDFTDSHPTLGLGLAPSVDHVCFN